MNQERLAAIRTRVEAATEGPWVVGDHEVDAPKRTICGDPGHGALGLMQDPDAAFIAAARIDVPDLLARVEELEAALREIYRYGEAVGMVIPDTSVQRRHRALLDGES